MIRFFRFVIVLLGLLAGCASAPLSPVNTSQTGPPERGAVAPLAFQAGVWVPDWTALGPFESTDEKGLERDYLSPVGGEAGLAAAGGAVPDVASLVSELPSLRVLSAQPQARGFVDFNRTFAGEGESLANKTAYAWADIVCPRTGYAFLHAGSDDGLRLWINGRLVIDHAARRAAGPDQHVVVARLTQGLNRCLVKVDQGTGDWGFYLRFGELVAETPGIQVRALDSIEPPVVLLGSRLPIVQTLYLSVLHHGTEPAGGMRVRVRSASLLEASSEPVGLKPGEKVDLTLDLRPQKDLEPGTAVEGAIEAILDDGSVRLLATLQTSAALAHPLLRDDVAGDGKPFCIVQLSDTHIERPDSVLLEVNTARRLRQAVAEINAMNPPPAFVVVTGDFTHNTMDAYPVFARLMDNLEVPWLPVFGNHDKASSLAAAQRAFSEWGLPEYYAFVYKSVPCIALDSVAETLPAYGRIPPRQVNWLDGVLRRVPADPRLVFIHHDLFSGKGVKNYVEVGRSLGRLPGRDWVFSGHWHADAFVREGDQRHIVSSSTGYVFPIDGLTQDRKTPGYRLIEIDNGRITTRFKPLAGEPQPDPAERDYWTVKQVLDALVKGK